MAKRSKQKATEVVVPIDLPGQEIQCWAPDAQKVTLLLRKHRDVIFDINISLGAEYLIQADQDYLYDANIKKLITPKTVIRFKDGQKMHFWLSRNFKGKLTLWCGAKKINEYSFADSRFEEVLDDPAFKPAPIIININNSEVQKSKPFSVIQADGTLTPPLIASEAENFLHVIELDPHRPDAPREILDFFKNGSQEELIFSGGIVTRNWIFNQAAAAIGYGGDNLFWIKELWGKKMEIKKVTHKNAGKKIYVILTGSSRVRNNLSASRYGIHNSKVLAFTFGAGSAQGLRHASWASVKGGFGGIAKYAVLFTVAIDIAEWIGDYEQIDVSTGKRKQDFTDLLIKIGIDVSKNVMNGVITTAILWGILALVGGGSFALVVVGTVFIGVGINYIVDLADKNFGISDKAAKKIKDNISKLEEKYPADYREYGKSLEQALIYGEWDHDS